ncbi:hypothetical protein [Metabacillus niabensis]|uniref:hypothetical protein n=1 Tax=Metabacillus TaxID=2675233 RepID=UPI000BA52FC1|nr:hypothetical protein [Metabacillus niabensis]PAD68634.1 hypothetical protein CHH83_12740 [Bacillus sp. 7586-K]
MWIIIVGVITVILFFLNILALMEIVPIFITSPLLFISLFITLYLINHRKTFKGF